MKIGVVKKSFSLNLLSLSGYVVFAALLLLLIPTFYLNRQSHDGGFFYFMFFGATLGKYWEVLLIIQIALVLLAIIEFIFHKRGKSIKIDTSKIPAALIKIHPFVFWLGIFFVFTPLYLLILVYGFR